MKQVKTYVNNLFLNGEQKKSRWENIVKARLQWWENEYERLNKLKYFSAGQKELISREIQQMAKLETDGGKCPKCKLSWNEIKFDNAFGAGRYFEPNCQCYFKCPRCKKHLYDVYVTTRLKMDKYTCPGCGWILLYEGEERFGPDYENFYDNQRRKPKNINIKKVQKAVDLSKEKYCGVSYSYKGVMDLEYEIRILD